MDYSDIYKHVEQSIVNVVIFDNTGRATSTATGAIIDDGQKVLTNSSKGWGIL